MIERAIKIALTTTEQIVKKDHALDHDETRMRTAAHSSAWAVQSTPWHGTALPSILFRALAGTRSKPGCMVQPEKMNNDCASMSKS